MSVVVEVIQTLLESLDHTLAFFSFHFHFLCLCLCHDGIRLCSVVLRFTVDLVLCWCCGRAVCGSAGGCVKFKFNSFVVVVVF